MVAWGHVIVNHLTHVNLACWAKMIDFPIMGKGEHAYGPLDLIHFDVCGQISINAKGGFVYFITFIDDNSLFGYLYLIRCKFESI